MISTERWARAKGRDEGLREGLQKGCLLAVRENILDLLLDGFSGTRYGLRDRPDGISDEAILRQLRRHAARRLS